jgi:hypothetical protein
MPDSRDKDGARAPVLRGNGRAELGSDVMNSDPRFDRWLSRRLHEAYDSVLKEALPAELERLVLQLAAQEDASPREALGQQEAPDAPHRRDGSVAGPLRH